MGHRRGLRIAQGASCAVIVTASRAPVGHVVAAMLSVLVGVGGKCDAHGELAVELPRARATAWRRGGHRRGDLADAVQVELGFTVGR